MSTQPGNDVVVAEAPDSVVVRFDEPVETALGAVRVFDGNGERVDTGAALRPDAQAVGTALARDLAGGTYTAAWRVVSADGHPVHGAFVFHVGAPGADPDGVADRVLEANAVPRAVALASTAARFLLLTLLLLAVGGTVALALTLADADPAVRTRLLCVIAGFAGALALVSLATIGLKGAEASGLGFSAIGRPEVLESVLQTRVGQVAGGRAAVAALLAALLLGARRGQGWTLEAALLACAGLVISPAAAGHARTSGALAFVMDVVHVQAAAVWIGGLGCLALALRLAGAGRWELAGRAVPRFSTLAAVSVAALLVAGLVNGYLQVRAWSGLWETAYGRLLLVKAGLLLPILGLAAVNRRLVPRIGGGSASAPERRRFLRAAAGELVLAVAVLSATAVLVAEPPAAAVASATGPFAATTELGDLELNLVVDPGTAGSNDIHADTLDTVGRPVDLEEVDVSATLVSQAIGPLRLEMRRVAPGHYLATEADLPLPGDWQLGISARRGEFESLRAAITVPIRKDSRP